VSDEKQVSLREINSETVQEVIKLSLTLSVEHQKYVAPNAVSIAEVRYSKYGWERAIYADEDIVGFVMFSFNLDAKIDKYGDLCTAYLWRFMIGTPYQGKGYGKKALEIMFEDLKNKGHEYLWVIYVPGKGGPANFYKKIGFEETGSMDGNIVMKKKL